LTAPPGFKEYHWFNADLSQELGTGNTLEFTPSPPVNSIYAVKLVPFPGQGCTETVFTTIMPGQPVTNFEVPDSLYVCSAPGGDLTKLTTNFNAMEFAYFSDEACTVPVNGRSIRTEGKYFIRATSSSGCSIVKGVEVAFRDARLIVTNPPVVYAPFTVDLTDPSITAGSSPDIQLSYWKDAAATVRIPDPSAVSLSGTYYIRGNTGTCTLIRPVAVSVRSTIPGTFTPNGDGINDRFNIAGSAEKIDLRIYNRWGEEVFASERRGNSWDGTSNGKQQPSGSYYWILRLKNGQGTGKNEVMRGSITLIR
jgi:gliding motility-associated-like protein